MHFLTDIKDNKPVIIKQIEYTNTLYFPLVFLQSSNVILNLESAVRCTDSGSVVQSESHDQQSLTPLAQLAVQLDGHELNFRVTRFDVDGSQEKVQGAVQLPLAETLPPPADQ